VITVTGQHVPAKVLDLLTPHHQVLHQMAAAVEELAVAVLAEVALVVVVLVADPQEVVVDSSKLTLRHT